MQLLDEALANSDASYEDDTRRAALSDQCEEDKHSDFLDAIFERLKGLELLGVFDPIMDKIREGEL